MILPFPERKGVMLRGVVQSPRQTAVKALQRLFVIHLLHLLPPPLQKTLQRPRHFTPRQILLTLETVVEGKGYGHPFTVTSVHILVGQLRPPTTNTWISRGWVRMAPETTIAITLLPLCPQWYHIVCPLILIFHFRT